MPQDEFIGRVIDGRYRVDAVIGEGAMGVVYRCRHVRLDKNLAIKILRRERGLSEEIVHRFVKEARLASSLKHPNVVDLSDCGALQEGGAYYVMEFLEGEALAETLARERRIAPRIAFAIVQQIVLGLQAAHAREIVHRDLKPENVLLCRDAEGGLLVKLLDFGIARAKDSKDTVPGTVLGTPEYMAPEQARGDAVDMRADLYALGVMLFEMLSGRVPLWADDIGELIRLKLTAEPQRLRQAAPDLANMRATEQLLAELLQREPERRIATIGEVARRLADALAQDFAVPDALPKRTQGIGSGEIARPSGGTALLPGPEGDWQRPVPMVPSAEQASVTQGKTVPASSQPVSSQPPVGATPPPVNPRPRGRGLPLFLGLAAVAGAAAMGAVLFFGADAAADRVPGSDRTSEAQTAATASPAAPPVDATLAPSDATEREAPPPIAPPPIAPPPIAPEVLPDPLPGIRPEVLPTPELGGPPTGDAAVEDPPPISASSVPRRDGRGGEPRRSRTPAPAVPDPQSPAATEPSVKNVPLQKPVPPPKPALKPSTDAFDLVDPFGTK